MKGRKDILRRDGRCFVCLQFGHRGSQCSWQCRQCNGKHHQSICERKINKFENTGEKTQKKNRSPADVEDSNQVENEKSLTANTLGGEDRTSTANQTIAAVGNLKGNKRTIFLQTATTTACANGTEIPVRILMDSGSQRTYVTDALKNKLSLNPERSEVLNLNTFGNDQVEKRRYDQIRLQLKGQTRVIEITALSFPKICAPNRADSLSGDAFVSNEDQQLTDVLHKFWSTESIGIFEETDVGGKEFLSDVKYDETKSRYQVRLPWKEGCLPESSGYPQCAKRLEHVYSRLKTEPVLLQEYDNVIRQQLRTGIIEEVSEPTKLEGTYYLPHHGVVRREKLTTKVRVVFDGSAWKFIIINKRMSRKGAEFSTSSVQRASQIQGISGRNYL